MKKQNSYTRRQFLKLKEAASKQLQFLDGVMFSRITRKKGGWVVEISTASLKRALSTAEIEKKLRSAIKARDAAIDARGDMALRLRDSKRALAEATKEIRALRKQTRAAGETRHSETDLKKANAALMARIRGLESGSLEERERFYRESARNIFNGTFKSTSRGAVSGGLPGLGKRK